MVKNLPRPLFLLQILAELLVEELQQLRQVLYTRQRRQVRHRAAGGRRVRSYLRVADVGARLVLAVILLHVLHHVQAVLLQRHVAMILVAEVLLREVLVIKIQLDIFSGSRVSFYVFTQMVRSHELFLALRALEPLLPCVGPPVPLQLV